jgi:hypothetical protein
MSNMMVQNTWESSINKFKIKRDHLNNDKYKLVFTSLYETTAPNNTINNILGLDVFNTFFFKIQ